MAGYITSALLAASLATAGVASTAGIRSADALPAMLAAGGGADASTCAVKINRTGTAGAASVVRDQLTDGQCACVITTGATAVNGVAEGVVDTVLRDRECAGASSAETATAGAGAGAGAAVALLPILLGAGAVGGLAIALSNVSNG